MLASRSQNHNILRRLPKLLLVAALGLTACSSPASSKPPKLSENCVSTELTPQEGKDRLNSANQLVKDSLNIAFTALLAKHNDDPKYSTDKPEPDHEDPNVISHDLRFNTPIKEGRSEIEVSGVTKDENGKRVYTSIDLLSAKRILDSSSDTRPVSTEFTLTEGMGEDWDSQPGEETGDFLIRVVLNESGVVVFDSGVLAERARTSLGGIAGRALCDYEGGIVNTLSVFDSISKDALES
ncbi:MAG TPA: hypothetical protein VLG37_04625 [Candidatus Saccharimonadales bacterium]|nr:hypothetical protein [Candidatus Saccharimonadales bacterium]